MRRAGKALSCFLMRASDLMKPCVFTTVLAIILAVSADALAGRVLTMHLDGTRIEQRETARKGYLEIPIPLGAVKDSLRIAPEKGVQILRVVTAPQKPVKNVEKELGQLVQREEVLNDRLKALSVREDIYKSAAKSQSAKAPRRTKTNPEPLSAIKQGTDYAITQLETVYHAKRAVEKELSHIAERRSRLGGEELSGGTVARVWLTPAAGSVIASWSQMDRRWSPVYQLRADDHGSALIYLTAQGVTLAKGETAELVLGPLRSPGYPEKFRYESEWTLLKKEEFKINITQEVNLSPFIISFTNSSALNLPEGEMSCFKSGVYMGKGNFQGVDVGKATEIICGGR
jgi:hypothetical protein